MPKTLLALLRVPASAGAYVRLTLVATMITTSAPAQVTPPGTATAPGSGGEQALVLSPFTVDVKRDTGYQATSTLAGTRLNSSLRDIAGQITVMTPEFMQDLGITDLNSALFYSLNTESDGEMVDVTAPGIGGAYSTEYPIGGPGTSIGGRTRGIGSPNRAHDFFDTVVPIDSYNTERFTFASGPNSILFGNAQPGGTIDTTFKRASAARAFRSVELRFDDAGSSRIVVDLNQPIIGKDVLALRAVALRNRTEDWRDDAFDRSDRRYVTATYQPFKTVSLRAYYERSTFHLQAALESLLQDHVTPWIEAGRPAYNNATPPTALPARTGVFLAYPANTFFYAFDGAGSFAPTYGSRTNMSQSRGYDTLLAAPYAMESSITNPAIYPTDVNYTGNSNQMKAATSITGVIGEFNPFRNFFVEVGYNRETYIQRYSRFLPLVNTELFVDANTFLQDRVTPNPNFGRYFMQSPVARAGRNRSVKEQARVSLSYELNLEKGQGWRNRLGRHRIATLFDRNDTEFYNGRSDYKVLNRAPGQIEGLFTTYYVDPTDRKNLAIRLPFDPLQEGVINVPGVSGLQIQAFDPAGSSVAAFVNRSVVDSRVLSWQGFFFGNRVGLTYGRREDDVTIYESAGDLRRDIPVIARDPQWRRLNERTPVTTQKSIIVHPTDWASAFYTESNSEQVPSLVRLNPNGTIARMGIGRGKEYGFSLQLLKERLSLRLSKYENAAEGNVSNMRVPNPLSAVSGFGRQIRHDSMNLEHNALRQAAARGRNIFADKYRGLQDSLLSTLQPDESATAEILDRYDVISDSKARGYELTLVGNPTPNWRIAVSGAKNQASETNIATEYFSFIRDRLPVWLDPAWRNELTVAPSTGARITALDAARLVIQNYDFILKQEGREVQNLRKYRANITVRYGFSTGWLKGAFIGANYNWRSALISGYKWTDQGGRNSFAIPGVLEPATLLTPDLNQPTFGSPLVTFDGFMGYSRKIERLKTTWRVQLNVRNLLDNTDLIHQRSNPDGIFVSSAAKQPRSFILTNTFTF